MTMPTDPQHGAGGNYQPPLPGWPGAPDQPLDYPEWYPALPPGYPPYPDPYSPYPATGPSGTNGLAIGSLVTSIAGVILGIPLTAFCYVGVLIPIIGIVLGALARNEIKHTNQAGRGLATAGIVVGAVTLVLQVLAVVIVAALAVNRY
ncbi:MAG: DUF4190 domain-containing protein [Mycobacterium sp.]